MQITKLPDGTFAVRFDYALKDAFREAFKSPTWDRQARHWIVGPRSGKRLEQWRAEVEDTESALQQAQAETEQAELKEAELKNLREHLAVIRTRRTLAEEAAKRAEQATDELVQVRQEIQRNEAAWEAASKRKAAAERVAAKERERIAAILAGAIDLQAAQAAAAEMGRLHHQAGTQERERFRKQQMFLDQERAQLAKAGYRLAALEWLVDANFNRPDRDDARRVEVDDWYRLTPIAPPDRVQN